MKISGDTITKATGGNATGENSTGGSGIVGSFVNVAGGTINTTGGSGKSGGAGVSTESGIVSIGNSDTPLDLTATSPDADNAVRGRDGKKLDEIIHLEENGKLGLVKLVENDENGKNVKTLHFHPLPLRCCSPRCGRYAFHPQPQRLHRQLHRGRRRPQRTAEVSKSPSSIPST